MSEGKKEQLEPQEPDQRTPHIETGEQPQAEMPENFVEPEGKSGRWGKPVKGEVEIEGKKVEVSYREKVIELPKHRQEATGIKRIRRRELLPPFPEGLFISNHEKNITDKYKQISSNVQNREYYLKIIDYPFWNDDSEQDEIYKFLTDGRYPQDGTWCHLMNKGVTEEKEARVSKKNRDFKNEGLYFQKIFPKNASDVEGGTAHFYEKTNAELVQTEISSGILENQIGVSSLFCGTNRSWFAGGGILNPVFVFGNRNKRFVEYLDSLSANPEVDNIIDRGAPRYVLSVKKSLDSLKNRTKIKTGAEVMIPAIRHPDIKPLRWCHAELAIIPTKRSLNVLFFETGDEPEQK
ncbi:MAG: hypothetical protein A2599_01830 [Candidatus Staskawiczbacteria bacterium RIFOXYD1_FULL_39_28]|uniref:Uncharacterized protein n=1 Tax=Candidatus Staskawiczbacteria bacterium RIFOXYC1_FULL_38_18 TaxID=1802229 RepID=A0A1G2JCY3_9BACT|nr:MAG: hypothetical protein A2401_03765 [Candidatus Staskawiczbacteria bacterium RIFOXYC1_FULL_38_18]OGZ91770.1 MAG: hypothetical protein A2599_01830 [Candidatus Staskawiczbacteria bacterium RIFOXYD1_FULL_39_28]